MTKHRRQPAPISNLLFPRWRTAVAFSLGALFIWFGAAPTVAGLITFVKVAEDLDAAPSGGQFGGGFGTPAVDSGVVAFTASADGLGLHRQGGLYSYSAGLLQRVAAAGDLAPASGIYTDFTADAPSVDSGRVGFMAVTTAGQGVFLSANGTTQLMVRQGDPVPLIGGTFSALYAPSFSGNRFVFAADDSLVSVGHAGVFAGSNGQITPIALQGFAKPGGGHFSDFDIAAAISGNTVVFLGDGSAFQFQNGLMSIAALATVTPAPPIGAAGIFSDLADVTIDRGRIAFRGDTDSGQQGIYIREGSTISEVSQRGNIRSGTGDFFTDFGSVSLSQNNLAFYGAAGVSQGIYFETGSALSRVIGTGDVLDGQTVASIAFGSEGLSGDQIAFGVTFSDGANAIYLADVSTQQTSIPEPASISLAVFGAAILFARNRCRWRRMGPPHSTNIPSWYDAII